MTKNVDFTKKKTESADEVLIVKFVLKITSLLIGLVINRNFLSVMILATAVRAQKDKVL